MVRTCLISFLCFNLLLMGVTGVHAHVPAPQTPVPNAAHVHHGAYVVSIIDTDHEADHEEDGDVDIEPLTKAFGKSTLGAAAALVAILVGIVIALARVPSLRVPVSPPLRPPKPRRRFFLLPPSHAPPSSLR